MASKHMGNKRMLHKKISISIQVNRLKLPARLLFTWLIAHADDEGRLKGEAEYVKATVVPMTDWTFDNVKDYLKEIQEQKLIYYWEENNEWFIEFVKWTDFQKLRKDRLEKSKLPPYKSVVSHLETKSQPTVNQETTQNNINKVNISKSKVNKSEFQKALANKNSYELLPEPKDHPFEDNEEYLAYETWERLEPNNKKAFYTTYLPAAKRGLPANKFGEFASEIEQDKSIINSGAVFNAKVERYLQGKEEKSGGN